KGFRAGRDTSLPEAKSLRRDDGRGQIVTGSVTATITRPQIGRPPPHLIPSGGGLAPTTDRRVTRRRDDATKGLTVRGPLEKFEARYRSAPHLVHIAPPVGVDRDPAPRPYAARRAFRMPATPSSRPQWPSAVAQHLKRLCFTLCGNGEV